METNVSDWLAEARLTLARLDLKVRELERLEAEVAVLTAEAIEAYEWPIEIPLPATCDTYGASAIGGVHYGEDLILELAAVFGCSAGAAAKQVYEVSTLVQRLPQCWQVVAQGQAPLWQARKIAAACDGLDAQGWELVDRQVWGALGSVGSRRFFQLVEAAVEAADPEHARHKSEVRARYVTTGADEHDRLTGWLSARLDRADSIFLEAMVQRIADALAAQDDTGSDDERRAKALGMLANPAAVVKLVGLPTLRGLDPELRTEEFRQVMIEQFDKLAAPLTPMTQVYVHFHADTIEDANALVRSERIGPLLVDQVKQVTGSTNVRLTPAVHIGGAGEVCDMYETPTRIREQVLLRDPFEIAPFSSRLSRGCDIDHTKEFRPGRRGQTRADNLGPLGRRFHRAKTHGGWELTQPRAGVFIWKTPAGLGFQVDNTGTHRLARRE